MTYAVCPATSARARSQVVRAHERGRASRQMARAKALPSLLALLATGSTLFVLYIPLNASSFDRLHQTREEFMRHEANILTGMGERRIEERPTLVSPAHCRVLRFGWACHEAQRGRRRRSMARARASTRWSTISAHRPASVAKCARCVAEARQRCGLMCGARIWRGLIFGSL